MYVQWNLDLRNLHKYNEVRGIRNYISSPSNSKNIDIWKRTSIWKILVQCSKLGFVQSRLWRPKIIKWSQGKLLKSISETVSVQIIGSYFCQVSVVFSAENASPEASSFKLLNTSSTWHIIVNSTQWLNKRISKAVLLLLYSTY